MIPTKTAPASQSIQKARFGDASNHAQHEPAAPMGCEDRRIRDTRTETSIVTRPITFELAAALRLGRRAPESSKRPLTQVPRGDATRDTEAKPPSSAVGRVGADRRCRRSGHRRAGQRMSECERSLAAIAGRVRNADACRDVG